MKKRLALTLAVILLLLTVAPAGNAYATGESSTLDMTGGIIQVGIASGKQGDTVTVPVTVTGNPGFAGFTFEVKYTSHLQLTKIAKGNLLKESESGSLTTNLTKNLINWNDSVNTADDGEILVLTFKIADSAASGDYAISLSLKDGKASNMVNEEGTPVAFTYQSGRVTVLGTASGSIQVGAATGKAGDTVTVPVSINDNPGFAGFTLEASYPSQLQLTKVAKGDLLKESDSGSLTSNVMKNLINWNDSVNTTSDGEILVFTFKIVEGTADGSYPINLALKDGKASNFVNEEGTPVPPVFNAGAVTVQNHVHEYVAVITPPTCTEQGYTTHTCSCGDSYIDTYVPALGHNWNAPTYIWASDNGTVTATRTCKNDASHVETETANTTSEVTTPATCTAKGKTTYTATFTNSAFATQTKTVENVPALGHNWNAPTYTWAADNSTVTATRTCKNDASHTETETVNTTNAVTTSATCTAKGKTTYTATFMNSAFAIQTKTVENVPALGHTPAAAVKENEIAATCTVAGGYDMVVYCSVCSAELSREHSTIDAIGHNYELTGWTWTGFTAANATFTCKNDPTHVESVDATITSVRTEPTPDDEGSVIYTAKVTFEGNEYTDTKTDIIPALGHEYELTGWTWRGYTAATATFSDKNSGDPITVDAIITSERIEPTCEAEGSIVYTATVTFEGLEYADAKTEELAALGHDWNDPSYAWADDNSTVTASRNCKRNEAHIEKETVGTVSEVIKEATYETEGEVKCTASFKSEAFEEQTKIIITPKLEKPDNGLPCNGGNTCPGKVFTDMPAKGNWAHDAIDWAIVYEITAGTSATTFSPDAGCTRAQVVTFLWRAAGEPEPTTSSNPFKDVKEGEYYYTAVLWAVGMHITEGTSATTFSPNATCTRAQIVTFLWRYQGTPEPASANNPFKDVKATDYYYNAVLWASVYGVTSGTSATTFSPNATCTRAQVVTFLYRSTSYAGKMTAYNENCYEIVVDNCTWEEAQAAAAAKGGKLVTFEDQYEYQFVLNLIAQKGIKDGYYHIGGRRDDDSTSYYWVDENNKLVGSALNGTTKWWNGIWEIGDPNFAWEGEPETVMILYYSKTEARWCWYDGWAAALTPGRQYAYIIEYD